MIPACQAISKPGLLLTEVDRLSYALKKIYENHKRKTWNKASASLTGKLAGI